MTNEEFRNTLKVTVLGVYGILPAGVWVDVCDRETGEVYAWTDEEDATFLRVLDTYSEEEVLMAEVVRLDTTSHRRATIWIAM